MPSAILAIIGILFLFEFLRGKVSHEVAWLAAIILGSSIQWFRNGTSTRVDLLLSVAVLIALVSFFDWYEKEFKKFPWIMCVSLAAATLTKGPVGIALPGIIMGLFLLSEKKSLTAIIWQLGRVCIPAGLIACSWYLICYQQYGDRFIQKIYYENIARLTSEMADEPHAHSFLYLYLTVILGLIPWILFLPFSWKQSWKIVTTPLNRFLLLWAGVFFIFFAIPESKRDTYLLPAYAPVAIFIAIRIASLSSQVKQRIAIGFLGISMLTLIAAVIIIVVPAGIVLKVPALVVFKEFIYLHSWTVVVGMVASISIVGWSLREFRRQQWLPGAAGFWIAALVLSQSFFIPAYANGISYKGISEDSAPLVQDEPILYSFLDEFYGISFYLKKPFRSVSTDTKQDVVDGVVYLYEKNLPLFKAKLRADQCLQTLMRSARAVVKEKQFALVVRVTTCQNPTHD